MLQGTAADQGAGQGELAPEGLVHVEQAGRHFLVSGWENDGNVVLLELLD
ncbi:hypothetical protein [Pseudomonas taeanensis]|nr:hypothetical protein [Pseudomonas taeanensis]